MPTFEANTKEIHQKYLLAMDRWRPLPPSGAPATVHPVRAEAATVPPAPLVTARALAPLPDLLTLAAPFLAAGGTCLFLKGANASSEFPDARLVAKGEGLKRGRAVRF